MPITSKVNYLDILIKLGEIYNFVRYWNSAYMANNEIYHSVCSSPILVSELPYKLNEQKYLKASL